MSKINILGVLIDDISTNQVIAVADMRIRQKLKTFIVTVNPEFVMLAQSNSAFRQTLNEATIAVSDGIGLLWAANVLAYAPILPSRVLKTIEVVFMAFALGILTFLNKKVRNRVISEQITGVDLSIKLAELCHSRHYSLFLLGEKEGIALEASKCLQAKLPGVSISGTFAGNGAAEGDVETRQMISEHPAEVVLVAYGAPKQEFWIQRNLSEVSSLLAMGVGGTFMFLSGRVKRAPQAIRSVGLEWLYRLATQPWRWRRQLALPLFICKVIAGKIRIECR